MLRSVVKEKYEKNIVLVEKNGDSMSWQELLSIAKEQDHLWGVMNSQFLNVTNKKQLCSLVINYSDKGKLYLIKPLLIDPVNDAVTSATISAENETLLCAHSPSLEIQPLIMKTVGYSEGLPDPVIIKKHLDALTKHGWQIYKRTGFFDTHQYQRSIFNRILASPPKYNIPKNVRFDESK